MRRWQEAQSIPDQVDEAVSYIKSLQANLEKLKEKKESLMGSRKRPQMLNTTAVGETSTASLRSPVMEIRDMGSNLQVTLVTAPTDQSIFYDIIGILHEENAEVLSTSFSVVGNSIFHVILAQVLILFLFSPLFLLFFFLGKIGLFGWECELFLDPPFWADWGFYFQLWNKVDM